MTLPWIAISLCPHTKLKQEMEVNNHDIFSSMIVYLYLSLLMWRSDRPKYRPQITQLVKHLTRKSMGTGSSTGLVHNYFSHPITFRAMPAPETDKLTPARERVCVVPWGLQSFKGEECEGQNSSKTSARLLCW